MLNDPRDPNLPPPEPPPAPAPAPRAHRPVCEFCECRIHPESGDILEMSDRARELRRLKEAHRELSASTDATIKKMEAEVAQYKTLLDDAKRALAVQTSKGGKVALVG